MAKSFPCLPFVDNCCICVPDLKTAVYLISIYGMLDGFIAIVRIIIPPCNNMRGGAFGTTVFVFEIIVCVAGTFVFLSAVVMVFSTAVNNPILKPFIIFVYVEVVLTCILLNLYLVRMITLNFVCTIRDGEGNKQAYGHPLIFVMPIIVGILEGAVMTYYTFVVNSYGQMWDDFDGDIPEPMQPDVDIQVISIRSAPATL